MAPKSSTGKEKATIPDEDEEPLQAVILADSFNNRFRPLTLSKPRCLLPVCNAPLLDWTFESLALAGVQEIFVVCRSHSELVKAAIRASKWSQPTSGVKITPLVAAREAFSPGDALRDVYTHGIIKGDFVLVHGDLVSNIRIDEVVKVHKERRRVNKDAIMTMVLAQAGASHRTRPQGETSVFVLDAETSQCLHYESVPGHPPKAKAHIPREILVEHPEFDIRNDLIDCGIDICSVEVPSLFQDNFDYLDIRRDFVHGVLTSDLLGKSIFAHVVTSGYAARVKDTKSYAAVSKDILARWTFPLVPDDNHPAGDAYEHLRGNRYVAVDGTVQLSRSSTIGRHTLVGAGSSVSHDAIVVGSVLGHNVTVGAGASVRDAYVWDNAQIGHGAVVEGCVIGEGVVVGPGGRIEEGCLLEDGVVLGPEAILQRFTRVSRRRSGKDEVEEDEDEEIKTVEAAQTDELRASLGKASNGVIWPYGPAEDDEDMDELENFSNQRLLRLGDNASDLDLSDIGSVTSSERSEMDSDESDDEHIVDGILAPSLSLPGGPIGESEFQSEVRQSLERAFAEGHSVDNAAVELKTLRMASNVPLRRVREAVVAAIVERIPIENAGAAAQRKEIGRVVQRWGPLIDRIGGRDAVETVSVLQGHCANSTRLPLFGQILAALYQSDIVEEDEIREWHATSSSKGSGQGTLAENMHKCWTVGGKMIEQFDEQEDESESD
ncbi:nucleotide-diphospho-sugar transferase [Rickenella mellea]|uniref:Translation initiation factor eIF2B subunit epsilon n=1 Tax=Rickenella mellea TaxID=50990 RepID=A0A4Y7QI99_9AGAM|nr:nucleotide-diphospho-sugar transferase [Rickenella mellea]